MLRYAVLFLTACSLPEPSASVDGSGPGIERMAIAPQSLDIAVPDPFMLSIPQRVEVRGDLVPGDQVRVMMGLAEGAGPCPAPLGGLCLDILSPRMVGTATVTVDGLVAMPIQLPPMFGEGRSVVLQALVPKGPDSASSFVATTTTALPNPGCTDPSSVDYDPAANIDNGSCTYPCAHLDDGDGLIGIADLNACLSTLGAAFAAVEYIDVAYDTSYLDDVCGAFGLTAYLLPYGEDQCEAGTHAMYPSFCEQGWLGDACENTCHDVNYEGFYCVGGDRVGCTDPTAFNFDPLATVDDGCVPVVEGCMDPIAENYDPSANVDDGSCRMPGLCSGLDQGEPRVILVTELNACLEAQDAAFFEVEYIEIAYGNTEYLDNVCEAFGYDAYGGPVGGDLCDSSANMYPSHCGQGWLGDACGNGCGNTNYDGFTCVGGTVEGCTDATAWNYEPEADVDDGTCEAMRFGCTNPLATNHDPTANVDDGSCAVPTVCAGLDPAGDGLIDVSELNACLDASGSAFAAVEHIQVGYGYESYLDDVCTAFGYGVYLEPSGTDTCTGGAPVAMYPSWCGQGWLGDACLNTCGVESFSAVYCTGGTRLGCNDPTAFNYNRLATVDDGSCIPVVLGCTDPLAVNYDPAANVDDGTCMPDSPCESLESVRDRRILVTELNTCLQDIGALFYEIEYIEVAYGNTDYLDNVCVAFGYDAYAGTYGDDLCDTSAAMYPSHCGQGWLGAECGNGCGNGNYDGFLCSGGTIYGCTDPGAPNYDSEADVDDGSCQPVISGCTNVIASNYDSAATVDDGSCLVTPLCNALDDEGDGLITVDELNACLAAAGSAFSAVEHIQVAYGDNGSLDRVCEAFGYGAYLQVHGEDTCSGAGPVAMYPSWCGEDWLGDACYNTCGADSFDGVYCTGGTRLGCTDAGSLNYDPIATVDDGTCIPIVEGCTDPLAGNYDPAANVDDGSCVLAVHCAALDVGEPQLITVDELNDCLEVVGAAFYEVEYIEVAYGNTDYLDNVCQTFGYVSYAGPWGGDLCDTSANMYPSHCGQGWLGDACGNGCGNTNYGGFHCN